MRARSAPLSTFFPISATIVSMRPATGEKTRFVQSSFHINWPVKLSCPWRNGFASATRIEFSCGLPFRNSILLRVTCGGSTAAGSVAGLLQLPSERSRTSAPVIASERAVLVLAVKKVAITTLGQSQIDIPDVGRLLEGDQSLRAFAQCIDGGESDVGVCFLSSEYVQQARAAALVGGQSRVEDLGCKIENCALVSRSTLAGQAKALEALPYLHFGF